MVRHDLVWLTASLLAAGLTACSCETEVCAGVGCACDESENCSGGLVCDEEKGRCRAALTCDEIGCGERQLCRETSGRSDAECLEECEEGWYWNSASQSCDAEQPSCLPDAPNSILALCDEQHRECVSEETGARCGDCKPEAIPVDDHCELLVTCEELDCEAVNRGCEEQPNGHCTDCLEGYVEDPDSGTCRLPLTCDDLDCEEFCVEATDDGDAYCVEGGCGPQAAMDPDGNCVPCPPCDDAERGEAGPYLDEVTGEGRCICRTAPGYFWREGLYPGVTPCDDDGDGWVRGSVVGSLQSSSNAVRVNARCEVRMVDLFVLVNEAGQEHEVRLTSPLPLYETDRNDDQALLDQAVSDGSLPPYAGSGRTLLPREINSLTKACSTGQADFNDNGLADVNEWHGGPTAGVLPYLQPYLNFSYSIELHDGWYHDGAYYIAEKTRTEGAQSGRQIALVNSSEGEYWLTCARMRDKGYMTGSLAGTPLQGLDFAQFGAAPGWDGMNHHSQFKCVRVVDTVADTDPPCNMTKEMISAAQHVLNECTIAGDSVSPPQGVDSVNPWTPPMECATDEPASLSHGDVRMAIMGYHDYRGEGGYQRGCINECVEHPDWCPGYDPDPRLNSSQCVGDVLNFGRLYCGCSYNYTGETCEIGCPGEVGTDGPTSAGVSSLFLQWPFVLAPRTGYWLCGGLSATSYENSGALLIGDSAEPPSGYTIRGGMPARMPTAGVMCETEGDCEVGYRVR
ncbi:MAG: hypothetical protein ACOCVR_00045 [Myxococcota bacterium]